MNAPTSVSDIYESLKFVVADWANAYYVLDNPVVSDDAYDSMYRKLVEFERAHPELVSSDSPTQRVGGALASYLPPVKHTVPMLSLKDARNQEEANAFLESCAAALDVDVEMLNLTQEHKYDGAALELRYVDGFFVQAVTRGDGEHGEDVTHQARTIQSIPLKLPEAVTRSIRGEVVMTKSEFARVNERLLKEGGKPFANLRNAASGTLRALDPKVGAERRLTFYAYGLVDAEQWFKYHTQAMAYLKELGFLMGAPVGLCYGKTGLVTAFEHATEARAELPYDIDGMVFKLNAFEEQALLGWNHRTPKWAIAYKFPAEEQTTTCVGIDVQVGRTGVLTPVARLEPIWVGGVTVTNVTLHNQDIVQQKDVRIGDTVTVRRAGDVIPEIVRSHVELRPAQSCDWIMPTQCPTCGSPVVRVKAAHICTGGASCPDQRLYRIAYYGTRRCMDIDGLGESSVAQLIETGLIQKISDLYTLTEAQLANLPGWGSTSAQNLVAAIAGTKGRPLRRFIAALGIEDVGEGTSKRLAQAFGSWEKLRVATEADLIALDDIGPITASSILAAFADPHFGPEIDALAAYVAPSPEEEKETGPLTGKTVVVTGTLPSLKRDEAKALVEKLGGKTSDSVSKKTSYVLAGEAAGTKLDKALALQIPVVDEAWLRAVEAAGTLV